MRCCQQRIRGSGLGQRDVRAIVFLCIVFALALPECARNTLQPTGDGRLFLLVDIPPARAGGVIEMFVEVENLDPVRVVVFDHSQPLPNPGGPSIDVTNSLDWRLVQGVPQDLVGQIIPGGRSVRFYVHTNGFDENEKIFTLDGNTTVRLFVENPELPGEQHLQIELTLQQTF